MDSEKIEGMASKLGTIKDFLTPSQKNLGSSLIALSSM